MAVDVVAERRLGHVCEPCLRRRFGWTITDAAWQRETGCAVCERDACYRLELTPKPRDDEAMRADGGDGKGDDLSLCDEHFHALLADQKSVSGGVQGHSHRGQRAQPDRR